MMEKSRLADTHSVRETTKSAARELGHPDLKPEQLKVVETFVKGRDVFSVLPTGYGKSLCYACLPIVFDKLLGSNSSIVLVMTLVQLLHSISTKCCIVLQPDPRAYALRVWCRRTSSTVASWLQ